MPFADKFQLHIYAALAEQEREFIGARTKAALQAAKAKGKTLGGLRDKTMRRNEAIQHKARTEALKVWGVIEPMRQAGRSMDAIAGELNKMKVPASRGGQWTAMQIKRVIDRVATGEAAA